MGGKWSNKDNIPFYESLSVESFKGYAQKGGFSDCCDLDCVSVYLKQAKHIFEVGAGYGRVIDYLLENCPNAQITAIERSQQLCSYLNRLYQNTVELIHADLINFETTRKFDAILWMWSNISDFSKEEHLILLKKLIAWLNPGGKFIMDILLDNFEHDYVAYTDSKNYEVRGQEQEVLHGYMPSSKEIEGYAELLHLDIKESIEYKTTTGRRRQIFVFEFH